MKAKRLAGFAAISLVVLAGVGYHFVFGYVALNPVADNTSVLTRKNLLGQIGGNVVVYHDELNAMVIDTQLPPLASMTRAKVDSLTSTPVSKVIITHWHPDHSGGIAAFSSDADTIAHANVLSRLSKPQEGFGLTKPGSHHMFEARTVSGLPTQPIAKRLDIAVGSTMANVVHYPTAHTDGDLVVYFHKARIAVIGDLVWPNSFPYVDVHNGGSVTGLESALQKVIVESGPEYRFVPGHGATLTRKELREYLEMVSTTRKWVEAQVDQGQTLDQIVAKGLPDEWQNWSSNLVPTNVWIETVHASRSATTK